MVGADGIHSVLRQHVFPESRPVFSGTVTYRGVVPSERVPEWPAESWLMWLGKGKHFLVYPLRAGALINFVGFVPANEEMKESWSASGDPDALRREFADWDPRIGYLLGQVETTFRSALYDRDPLPSGPAAADAARRCRACDAPAPRARRQPVDRGRHGARDHPGEYRPHNRPRGAPGLRAASPRADREGPIRRARERAAIRLASCPTSICATPRSPLTPSSAGTSTITMSCRTHAPRPWSWFRRDAPHALFGFFGSRRGERQLASTCSAPRRRE